ncbi:MAG: helix-turn-helix transcriptional regulator [Acidobacteriaceae bacterium]|jgi:DNA-binding HxlR family transcriptional regulator|nr:helix-turn-helix transcriptional regulator [Acidobacteriaceae bacterium]
MLDAAPALTVNDECSGHCPVAKTARLIEGKWTTLIIRDLLTGRKRPSELLRSLAGISPKILAERLKFLEVEGIVEKTVYSAKLLHTEYGLTTRGCNLEGVIAAWAQLGQRDALSAEPRTALPKSA